jgi:hypothetical protein
MSTMADQRERTTTQVYRVYIKATPQQIWDAITDRSGTGDTGTAGEGSSTCAPGGRTAASPARR